jgi:hypothetical protein
VQPGRPGSLYGEVCVGAIALVDALLLPSDHFRLQPSEPITGPTSESQAFRNLGDILCWRQQGRRVESVGRMLESVNFG